MAHIFKHPESGNKGIVVFTHKELSFLTGTAIRKKDILRPIQIAKKIVFKATKKKQINLKIREINRRYFIGIHWGGYATNVITPDWVDFHMSAHGTATFIGDPYVIPMNSANFTPAVMNEENISEKYWDIICIAKNMHIKNLERLMKSVRKIYDMKLYYKVIFIISSNKIEPEDKFYNSIFKDYFQNFSPEERENFTILKLHPDMGFQGMSYTVLSFFLKRSKVFTLFSQQEGESRVVKEAQLCGLPVVVKDDMRGGGRDFLDEMNSVFFSTYDEAHDALIYAVENYKTLSGNASKIKEKLSEIYSVPELHCFFSEMYRKSGENFNGCLINIDSLNRRLPAHYYDPDTIIWASSEEYMYSTTDIKSLEMLIKFHSCLDI